MLLSSMLVSCKTSNEQPQYKSSDLQMELARGDVWKIEICELVPRRGEVVCDVKYTKFYTDEEGLLMSSISDFEEKEYLFDALREVGGENNTIIISRNADNQMTDMRIEDSQVWDSYTWQYDSLGYMKKRSANYFEAGQSIEYIYNEKYELVKEKIQFYCHEGSEDITREFSDIAYDSYNNWYFRKVDECTIKTDDYTSRVKRSSKTYYELRRIYYKESESIE